MTGTVYIVGAGPGDPELITLKAARLLERADVVLYDRLVPEDIVRRHAKKARLVYVGKKSAGESWKQEEINRMLVELARSYEVVVRLKGGDPYVFGRGEEECVYLLSHGVRCEVVPGLSSATAAPACSGIPLTSRWAASSFAVVTGREAEDKPERRVDLTRIAGAVDVVVVVMPVFSLDRVVEEIVKAKPPSTPAALIENGCTNKQRVIKSTLSGIVGEARARNVSPPAVLIVGPTVDLIEKESERRRA